VRANNITHSSPAFNFSELERKTVQFMHLEGWLDGLAEVSWTLLQDQHAALHIPSNSGKNITQTWADF